MRFAEFHVGQVIELGPRRLDEAELVRFATDYDPQWFHTDAAAAGKGRYGGLIASGWQTCGIAMRLVVDEVLAGSESFGSPGLAYLKWLNPVRPGDDLSVRITVLETRRSRNNPDMGIVRWRWQVTTGAALEVLELEATSLFDLSGSS